MNENELMHHGVLGMKWGHRKSSSRTSSHASQKKSATTERQLQYLNDDRKLLSRRFSNRGLNRIENRIKKGDSYQRSLLKENRIRMGTSVVASYIAYNAVIKNADNIDKAISNVGRAFMSSAAYMKGCRNIRWY